MSFTRTAEIVNQLFKCSENSLETRVAKCGNKTWFSVRFWTLTLILCDYSKKMSIYYYIRYCSDYYYSHYNVSYYITCFKNNIWNYVDRFIVTIWLNYFSNTTFKTVDSMTELRRTDEPIHSCTRISLIEIKLTRRFPV